MEFIKNNKIFIFLMVLGAICLCFSCGHLSDIYNDVGREMYYPYAILQNKVLYKDLFCIYPPLSYILNALFVKITGNLNILYFASGFFSLMSIGIIYLISRKYLSAFVSSSIVFFLIAAGAFSVRIFNYTFPYSFGVVYGLGFFLLSLYFLLSFQEKNKPYYIYLSSLFLGFSLCSKYEFFPYLLPFFVVLLKTKNIKLILKSILIVVCAILVPFLPLFVQGLKTVDIINAINLISSFIKAPSLKTFYLTQGVYFSPNIIINWAYRIALCAFIFFIMYLGVNLGGKNKILSNSIIVLVSLIVFLFFNDASYLYLTFIVFVLFLLFIKNGDFNKNIIISSFLLISLKSFWGLSYSNYGLYYTGVMLLSFFILLLNFKNDKLLKTAAFLVLAAGVNVLYTSFSVFKFTNTKIISDKGRIYTIDDYADSTNEAINFLNSIKEENPKVMIFPEGLTLNYLAPKKTNPNGFYNSLIPLYTEGFGEDKIIEYYKNNMPDYIFFSDTKMSSYGYGEICGTYAKQFCAFVLEEYVPSKVIEGKMDKFYILKRKKYDI